MTDQSSDKDGDTPHHVRLVTDEAEHTAPPREDNVIHLDMLTSLELDPDQILKEAHGLLDSVIIIGYAKGDRNNRSADDEYFASSIAAGDTVVWLLQRYIHKLMCFADKGYMGADGDIPPDDAS